MSNPISFGFGKTKNNSSAAAKVTAPKPILLPLTRAPAGKQSRHARSALHDDSEDEDESAPRHESVTGFTTSGAILSKPKEEKQDRVIVNAGNGDWRRRGRKNLLPSEVQAQREAEQNGGSVVTVERSEVNTSSGLQYASTSTGNHEEEIPVGTNTESTSQVPETALTEDDRALAALLSDGSSRPTSNTIIETKGNVRLHQRDEVADFREDVATRPEPATLEDYAAMPVEEFGMAMLRGMGQKRRANGEVIDFNRKKQDDDPKKKQRKQEGFLGIGAKAAPGIQGVELGAWGKADMRKNTKGEGFFTPVMLEDKRTGERITEDELEKRKREAKDVKKAQNGDDWRQRRDRNLERSGREEEENGSRKRDQDYDSSSSRSRRRRDSRDYDSSRSERESNQSQSKDRRRRDYDDEDDSRHSRDRHRDRDRDRDRDRHRDSERHGSSSSRRNRHRDEDYDRDERRHRDRR